MINQQKQKLYIIIGLTVLIVILLVFNTTKQATAPVDTNDLILNSAESTTTDAVIENTSDTVTTPTEQNVTPPAENTTPVTTSPASKTVTTTPTPTNNTTKVVENNDAYVSDTLAGDDSRRCTWIDSDGNEGVAVQLLNVVRTEVKTKDATYITIYKPTESYFWIDGEREGITIPRNVDGYVVLTGYTPYSKMLTYLNTNSRVKCDAKVINESHFTPPTNITFTEIVNN